MRGEVADRRLVRARAEDRLDPGERREGRDESGRVGRLGEEVEVAEQVGLDVYGVGEHHRPDFPVSSPAVVLAAAAATMGAGGLVYAVRSTHWRDARALAGEFRHGEAAFEHWLRERERWLLRSMLRR